MVLSIYIVSSPYNFGTSNVVKNDYKITHQSNLIKHVPTYIVLKYSTMERINNQVEFICDFKIATCTRTIS